MSKQSISKLKKKLDTEFSKYIRLSNADSNGMVTCYTCDKVAYWKDGMQCGHFYSRSKLSTRFDEDNCRVQCAGCNVFKNGNYITYTLRMQKELGTRKFNALKRKSEKMVKLDRNWYEEKIEHYKNLNKKLVCKKT